MQMSKTAMPATLALRKKQGLFARMWRARGAYLFIAPFYVLFALFGLFPILFSFYISFVSWSGFDQPRFVGVGNFSALFSDDLFWASLGNTIYLWLGHIFILLALALGLALLLNARWLGLRGIYRALIYLPNATATAAMALVFGLIFDYHSGILNTLLNHVGIASIYWLGSTDWSKPSIIILNIWNMTGWYMLILLAGLQTIDPVLYEAAAMDGANGVRKLLHVTLPGLKKVLFFCFMVETIGSLQIFAEPYILGGVGTGGSAGPENSMLTLAVYLYQNAFSFFKLGYAAAISLVLFALTVVISIAQSRFFRGEVFAE